VSAPAAPGIFHPESGRPSIRDFRPTEYRGHPQVYGVTQGTDRVIYLSTQEGITGFDGARWTHSPMPSAQVYELAATRNGRIWAGGNDEIGYFEPAPDGGLAYRSLREKMPETAKPWSRTYRVITHREQVYFTSPRGVLRVGPDDTVTFWPTPPNTRPTVHVLGDEVVVHLLQQGFFRLGRGELTPRLTAAEFRDAGGPALDTGLLHRQLVSYAIVMGVRWLLDTPALIMAAVPELADISDRRDDRIAGNEQARSQLLMLTNFLRLWQQTDLGAIVGPTTAHL